MIKFKLRHFKRGDENSLQKNINEKEIARNTLNVPHPYTMKDARSWVAYNLKLNRARKKTEINFVIDMDGKIAGSVGFVKIDKKNNNAELGYWLGKKHRGKEIMPEAVKQILEFGFKKLKLKRIYAHVLPSNKASQRVLEKTNFKFEGKLVKHARKKGKYYDHFLYAKVR